MSYVIKNFFADRDNIGIVLKLSLKDRPDVELIAATTHLLYNPKRADIKLAQTQVMLAEIERLAYKRTDPKTGRPEYLPIIFTGDMNYSPESGMSEMTEPFTDVLQKNYVQSYELRISHI